MGPYVYDGTFKNILSYRSRCFFPLAQVGTGEKNLLREFINLERFYCNLT